MCPTFYFNAMVTTFITDDHYITTDNNEREILEEIRNKFQETDIGNEVAM
jgi:hypothetical protein